MKAGAAELQCWAEEVAVSGQLDAKGSMVSLKLRRNFL